MRQAFRVAMRAARNKIAGHQPHIVITGTGRAGTTLLVRILAELGLDTDATPSAIARVENNSGRAGIEPRISDDTLDRLPLVVKAPQFVDSLPGLLDRGVFPVDVAIVPMRDLQDAAQSRIDAETRFKASGAEGGAPGGLWKTDDPSQQATVLAEQFYKIVWTLQRHEIPTIFPVFPRFALDFEHFERTVGAYLKHRFDFTTDELRRAHAAQCRPDFITIK